MAQQKLAPYISLSPGIAAQPFHAHFEKDLAWGSIDPEAVLNPTLFVKNLYSISGTAGLQYRLSDAIRNFIFEANLRYVHLWK
jgi:hypothetical protein